MTARPMLPGFTYCNAGAALNPTNVTVKSSSVMQAMLRGRQRFGGTVHVRVRLPTRRPTLPTYWAISPIAIGLRLIARIS